MEILKRKTAIPFMKYRFVFAAISLVMTLAAIFVWVSSGESKYGIDFLGGVEVIVKFTEPATAGEIRDVLQKAGFASATVQGFESDANEFSIRLKADNNAQASKGIISALESLGKGKLEVLKEDFVGPIIGEQIRRDGVKAIVFSLIGLLIYISFRFEWRFALGAVVALAHDVIITGGIFVAVGHEVSAAALAAILTVLGYSINDTIIVFDRIRENFTHQRAAKSGKSSAEKGLSFSELIDLSINQTLSRTILTSSTTLFVCFALWLLGGGEIASLAFVLVVGIGFGTYSSVYIASVVVLALDREFNIKSQPALQKAA